MQYGNILMISTIFHCSISYLENEIIDVKNYKPIYIVIKYKIEYYLRKLKNKNTLLVNILSV